MSTLGQQPDGEYFADTPVNPLPPADTWDHLSVNQLIDVKIQLTNRLFDFRSNPAIVKTLSASLQRLEALIALRMSSS